MSCFQSPGQPPAGDAGAESGLSGTKGVAVLSGIGFGTSIEAQVRKPMATQFARLFDALSSVPGGPPAELGVFLNDLAEVGELPSPWDTWTLVGLVRHRKRQLSVAEIIRTRLGGSLMELAHLGALGHPDGVPQSGIVPGLP